MDLWFYKWNGGTCVPGKIFCRLHLVSLYTWFLNYRHKLYPHRCGYDFTRIFILSTWKCVQFVLFVCIIADCGRTHWITCFISGSRRRAVKDKAMNQQAFNVILCREIYDHYTTSIICLYTITITSLGHLKRRRQYKCMCASFLHLSSRELRFPVRCALCGHQEHISAHNINKTCTLAFCIKM